MSHTILPQSQELIYALDIGTRSVIGMLGTKKDGKVRIVAMEKLLHTRRVMMDGQIEDIAQVAVAVRTVTQRLEQSAGCKLERACVAAAGRALRTQQGYGLRELSTPEPITQTLVAQLEASAVAQAEQTLKEEGVAHQQLLLVGYTATGYQLDGYPLSTLLGHTGQRMETHVVATFLPSGVIDSLYAVMREAGLEVASLTLEPIAALNAAIPADIRLLNLCLVDIGAGTSDIALCRDGSVVGYTMATVAGDEITEALMKAFLVDYATAENMKAQLASHDSLVYTDILGLEQTCTSQEAQEALEPAAKMLAQEIAQRVLELNTTAPSAVFLAGGGSKLAGLREKVADALGMDVRRVSVAGGHFKATAYSDLFSLDDAEYTTPLGIAVSAGLGLINDSCQVTLNGARAKLFCSGDVTVMDLLMMNGYNYYDLLGRNGKPLVVRVDGRRTVLYGTPPQPAHLTINGAQAQPSSPVHPGDVVEFTPAQGGEDCVLTAQQLTQRLEVTSILVDGVEPDSSAIIPSGAVVVTRSSQPVQAPQVAQAPQAAQTPQVAQDPQVAQAQSPVSPAKATPKATSAPCKVYLNGVAVTLAPKADGAPYYVMDLLERSGLDFQHAQRPVIVQVNDQECFFQQVLQEGDRIKIGYADEVKQL